LSDKTASLVLLVLSDRKTTSLFSSSSYGWGHWFNYDLFRFRLWFWFSV